MNVLILDSEHDYKPELLQSMPSKIAVPGLAGAGSPISGTYNTECFAACSRYLLHRLRVKALRPIFNQRCPISLHCAATNYQNHVGSKLFTLIVHIRTVAAIAILGFRRSNLSRSDRG